MSSKWPLDSQLLVVDDDSVFREAVVLQLSDVGCTCHVACSYEEALQVFQDNPEIAVVLVDQIPIGARVDKFVESLRASARDLVVVGNSGEDRRKGYSTAGVQRFLQKPWRIEQLVSLVGGRIPSCGNCGLQLPLRRPRVGEAGHSWACSFCGNRYRALLDEDAPPDLRLNARPAD